MEALHKPLAMMIRYGALVATLAVFGCVVAPSQASTLDTSFGENGILDTSSFGPRLEAMPQAIEHDGQRRFLAATSSRALGTQILRFRQGGSVDTIFGGADGVITSQTKQTVSDIAVQKDGRVLISEFRNEGGGYAISSVTRLLSNGRVDRSFAANGRYRTPEAAGRVVFTALATAPGGKILISGVAREIAGGKPTGILMRLKRNGSLDRSFGRGGKVRFVGPRDPGSKGQRPTGLMDVAVSGGKVLVSGYLKGNSFLARLTSQGKRDASFGRGHGMTFSGVHAKRNCFVVFGCLTGGDLSFDRMGRILVLANPGREVAIVRLRTDGDLDRRFGRRGVARIPAATGKSAFDALDLDSRRRLSGVFANDLGVDRRGRVVIAASGFSPGTSAAEPDPLEGLELFTILRLDPRGGLDLSFGHKGVYMHDVGEESAALQVLGDRMARPFVAGGVGIDVGNPLNARYSLVLARLAK